jgi:hypothetical protein
MPGYTDKIYKLLPLITLINNNYSTGTLIPENTQEHGAI